MQFITDALAAGRRATKTRSDAWVLRGQGKTHRVLVDAGGSLTKFGRFYETETGQTLERDRFDPDQEAEREGNTETIRLRGGDRGVVPWGRVGHPGGTNPGRPPGHHWIFF